MRKFVRAGAFPERATVSYSNQLEPYMVHLEQRHREGLHNARQYWREIKELGYAGDYKAVQVWLAQRREQPGRKLSLREQAQQTSLAAPEEINISLKPLNVPLKAPRHLAWILMKPLEQLEYLRCEPQLNSAYLLAQSFVKLLKTKQAAQLQAWLEQCAESGVAELVSFGVALKHQYGAVKAAFSLPFSNGQVEGQVNRLKLIKRQMYGSGSFELLRRKVLLAD